MAQQIPVDDSAVAPDLYTAADKLGLHQVRDDVAYQRLGIVNVLFIGAADTGWFLVDAGLPASADLILKSANALFGPSARPNAILLTHGHFDHVGALESLVEQWDVPVYAHEREVPYLDGSASYRPPDPKVGGGLMARMSKLYPRGPINVARWLRTFPADGSVPGLSDWKWIAVPGHTPGQVALWRERDRTLLSADAVVTTAQESVYAVAVQKPELHGPPMYYTQDWAAAGRSAAALAALEPDYLIAGHSRALHGQAMRDALQQLARGFDDVAVPPLGRYVAFPATAKDGTAYPAH